MRALKILLLVFLAVALLLLAVGLLLPDSRRLERSIVVEAPPATVYAVLDGFRQFNRWSPWAGLDPKTEYQYEGPPMGVGARLSWHSAQKNVGSGSQEIVEDAINEKVRMRLVFSGFDSENHSTLQLAAEGAHTRVTWIHESQFHGNLLGRYFGLKLEDWVGPDYEKGLKALQTFVAGLPKNEFGERVALVQAPADNSAGYQGYALRIGLARDEGEGAALALLQAYKNVAGLQHNGADWSELGPDGVMRLYLPVR